MTTTKATPDVEVSKKERNKRRETRECRERKRESRRKQESQSVLHPTAQRNARLFEEFAVCPFLLQNCSPSIFANYSGSLGLS